MNNLFGFLDGVPIALVVGFIASWMIPEVQTWLTKPTWANSYIAGTITAVLAVADGFFSEWAASADANHYDWRAALLATVSAYFLATKKHDKVLKGTPTEQRLLSSGVN